MKMALCPIGRYLAAVTRQTEAERAVSLAMAAADAAQDEVALAVAELTRLGVPRPVVVAPSLERAGEGLGGSGSSPKRPARAVRRRRQCSRWGATRPPAR